MGDYTRVKPKNVTLNHTDWEYIQGLQARGSYSSISAALRRLVHEHRILTANGFDVATLQVQGKIPYEVQP